jgi:hypothetical protein
VQTSITENNIMAELKTKPTKVDVDDFIDALEDEGRRDDCRALVKMMKKATKAKPVMWGPAIVGFGRYRYKYASGHEGEWPIIGFSPRKNDLTLYLMQGFERHEELLGRLGKHKTSKACLYIKKLEQVDQDALKELIDLSVEAMADKRVDR